MCGHAAEKVLEVSGWHQWFCSECLEKPVYVARGGYLAAEAFKKNVCGMEGV